jgi:hypothetical protein
MTHDYGADVLGIIISKIQRFKVLELADIFLKSQLITKITAQHDYIADILRILISKLQRLKGLDLADFSKVNF